MLLSLTLRNFKIWKTTGLVKLAPVTLLLGTNSSGKSSIIQSLLLIRQTVRGKDPNVALNFGSETDDTSVNLGRFSDVHHRPSSDKHIEIEFTWTPERDPAAAINFTAVYQPTSADAAEIQRLRLGRGEHGFTVTRSAKEVYKLTVGNARRPLGASREFRPQSSFTFSAATFSKMPPADAQTIRDAGTALLDELAKIIYLGPIRQLARREYRWSGRPDATIRDDGRNVVDALISSALTRGESHGALLRETGEWLQRMKLADGLEIRRLGMSPLCEVWVKRAGWASNLKDVGVGVSQVLPVIVAALSADPGHTVIVEEPESHLHPLAQSELAELFAQVSRDRKVQFIAETHSEHMFRRMQTLLAKEEIHPPDCALYFVEREGAEAHFRRLDADDTGRIKNWPPNFFGDALGETKTQTDLVFKRLKEARAAHGSSSH